MWERLHFRAETMKEEYPLTLEDYVKGLQKFESVLKQARAASGGEGSEGIEDNYLTM